MNVVARRALFTALILLTAFRGMVGDVMAYGVTQQMMNAQGTINSIAPSADSMPASGQFEHQKVASMPCHDVASTQGIGVEIPASESVCSTCQVCHLSVTLPISAVAQLQALPHMDKPSLRGSTWVSADPRLTSKPPLS